jgi:hypothetical protein
MGFVGGLAAQCGFKQETTPGSAVTVDHFIPIVSESLSLAIETTQGEGLYGSTDGFPLDTRWTQTTRSVSGDVTFECVDNGLGLWHRACVGSTTTPGVLSGSAYGAVFAAGDQQSAGSSLTVQIGRPGINGTTVPFSYNGCKVTDWEVGGSVTEPVNISYSLDGWNETTGTSLATASYSATAQQFSGADLNVKVGGTASTSSGKTTIADGVALTVKSATVKGSNPLYTDRYYSNASGIKAEQVINGYRDYTFELELDYDSTQTLRATAVAGTTTALQVYWVKPTAITGSYYPLLEYTAPAVKFEIPEINVDGPEQLSYTITAKVRRGSGSHNFFQIYTVNTDSAL